MQSTFLAVNTLFRGKVLRYCHLCVNHVICDTVYVITAA